MRVVSARWVIPIDRPPIADGALALAADGVIATCGPRSEVRAQFSDADEERAGGVLVPGLVNAHCHLELSALVDAVPGGAGLVAWAGAVMAAARGLDRERRRSAAAEAARGAVRTGTAAVGDVGNGLDAAPGIAAAGLAGVLFHELLGSREATTGDALADAAREYDEARAHDGWP